MNPSLNIETVGGRHFSLSFTTTLKRPLGGGRYVHDQVGGGE
jgi:hypothetical protein